MDTQPGYATLKGKPPCHLDATELARTKARAQLHRHGQSAPARRRPRHRHRTGRIGQQRGAGPRLAHLGHRAAHVDIDQVGAGGGDGLRRGGHHIGVVPEQLHRDGMLVGMDPQQLAAGPLVLVVHGEARDHLGHNQAGTEAAGLEAHEPVADPSQRREHDPIGNRNPAQGPAIGQRGRHTFHGTNQAMDLVRELQPWTDVVLDEVPDLVLFDAHTHLGENDPDGMRQNAPELLAGLEQAHARGAFVFPFHEPDGYRLANDVVLDAGRASDGRLVPFCRVNPHDHPVVEAQRALEAGARGIKLHPRAEQFTLDHPGVESVVALANERSMPVLIHAGRGIPALGLRAVQLAGKFPDARLILAHAGICDLSWIWRVAPDHPNLLFDTAWWMPADLQTLFSLVPPGQIVFASDAPYGATAFSAAFQLRTALQVGLSPEHIRSIASEQALRIARGEPLKPVGPAVGERERAPHVLLDRVAEFLLLGAIAAFRGGDATEMLALARLACDVPEDIDDAPVFDAIRKLLDTYDAFEAEHPGERRSRTVLILAATVARTPEVPLPKPAN